MPLLPATRLLSFFLFLFLITSCASPAPTGAPTLPTELPIPTETTAPADATVPAETATVPPTLTPALERPRYVIDMQLNYASKSATVDQTIIWPNWTGENLTNLVLSVVPNLWSGGFSLKSVSIDDQTINNYKLEAFTQRLEIPLLQPLEPGRTAVIHLSYGLILPQMQAYNDASNDIRPQIYGYSDRQVNFVDWYPFVVPYQPGQGWILHNPWFYGEHLVYDLADFDVRVTFTDGAAPQIAASGAEVDSSADAAATPEGAATRRFVLEAGRTFALSMSDFYKVATREVEGVTVYSYFFGFYDAPGEAMLQTTVEAMVAYTEKFGPYRHKTLTAVQGDFNDGMEFSALYFISRDYFNLYDNTPKNYLVVIAAHETAHMWWFDSVANDQALEPWLDEALSTYCERIYYETAYPELVDWWWSFRYFEFQQAGYVDTTIYDGGGQRPYWDKVYLTGARFFEDLRVKVGDEIFFTFLKDYYTQFVGGRASGADFFRVFHQNTAADITDLMTQYFQNTY